MIHSSWVLLRESGRIFLEAAPAGIDPDAVARALAAEDDVVEVHDLHVWTVTSGFPGARRARARRARRRLPRRAPAAPAPAGGAVRPPAHDAAGRSRRPPRAGRATRRAAPRLESSAMATLDLTGRTAIVTGASSGFGQATARQLAEHGVRVAGGARRVERLETEIALELDVTRPGELRSASSPTRSSSSAAGSTSSSTTPASRSAASRSTSRPRRTSARVFETRRERARADDAALPAAHPRRRPHRQHGLDRRPAGVRGRRVVRRGEVRRARLHVRAAGGSARPADPDHDRRPRASRRRSSRSSASRATRRRRPPSTRASTRSRRRTSPTASSSRSRGRGT